MTLRLLFVIDNLGSGGAQRQMTTLALGLHARGHSVDFFLYSPGDLFVPPLQEAGISIFRHLKSARYSPNILFDLRKRIELGQYDAILAYMTVPNFYAIVASHLLAKRPAVVVSERFFDAPGRLPWRDRVIRPLYRLADRVVVNSQHQYLAMLHKHAWLKGRISRIYNGLDLGKFTPAMVEPPDVPLKLIGIAHISPYKNQLCLVDALRILADNYDLRPQVSWVGAHAHPGHAERFAYEQRVKQAIQDHGLTNQWQWLYEREDIPELLRQHHALIHPSYGEGFPNVVCEAMACGRPIIVSNTLDHPLMVSHGKSGFLFDWQSPKDLAEKIKSFHDLTGEERHKMGTCSREFAEHNLSIERLVDEYEAMFTGLTQK